MGFEWNTKFRSRFTLEGYYKKYNNYPFLIRDQVSLANHGGDFGVIGNEQVESTSEVRSFGMELMYQQRLYKRFFGITSITLGRSQFTNGDGSCAPSSWDATTIANLTVGKRFKNNWEIGVKWRFQSGLPYSRSDSRSSLVESWDLRGVAFPDYASINTLRQDVSNQIDFRADKKWAYNKWSLELYLVVQNITSNVINRPALILDRPLDENETPI